MNWQNDFSVKNNIIYSEFQNRAFLLGKIKVRLSLITGLAGTAIHHYCSYLFLHPGYGIKNDPGRIDGNTFIKFFIASFCS